jgi:hypothetical protein
MQAVKVELVKRVERLERLLVMTRARERRRETRALVAAAEAEFD